MRELRGPYDNCTSETRSSSPTPGSETYRLFEDHYSHDDQGPGVKLIVPTSCIESSQSDLPPPPTLIL